MEYFRVAKPAEIRSDLYPDVLEARGLHQLMQACLSEISSTLEAADLDVAIPGFPEYARVERGARSCQIYIAADERLFSSDFWARGVCMAKGACRDPLELARTIDFWISNTTATTRDLARKFPFVRPSTQAQAFEDGNPVERRWTDYLESIDDTIPELSELIRAAASRPALRQLFPFTSVTRLCFSRCTGYPYSADCPVITPNRDGTFIVDAYDRQRSPALGAEEAVDWAVRHLPPDIGPAVEGTAMELPDASSAAQGA